MALHNFNRANYNSKSAARNRRRAASRRKKAWRRKSSGAKALILAKKNARLCKRLKPPMRYTEWTTPIYVGGRWRTDEPCWMPVVSRLCVDDVAPGVDHESKYILPRYYGSNASPIHINIGSTQWIAAFNADGLGYHPDGATIWDAMFDNGKFDDNAKIIDLPNRIGTVCAISSPINQVRFSNLEDKTLDMRSADEIYSHRLEFNYSIRIADAKQNSVHLPVVDRGLQPVNVSLYLVRWPVNKSTCTNQVLHDFHALNTDPYGTVNPLAIDYRNQIHNMFKNNPLLYPKRTNTSYATMKLRPGPKGAEIQENPELVPVFPIVAPPTAADLAINDEVDERRIRALPFKVIATKHHRLGTHGTSDILAKYETSGQFVLKLGKEKFFAGAGEASAYMFEEYEYRVICVHNGTCHYTTATAAPHPVTGNLPTYPTGTTPPLDNTENRVYMKTQVKHWFTSIS